MLIGEENLKKLKKYKVAVFGIGGVGSFVVEGLVRCGIENFVLVDNDKVDLTNINRQIHATIKTVGHMKVDIMKKRILEINPDSKVEISKEFYLPNDNFKVIKKDYDYVIDSIDTVTGKIGLVLEADKLDVPIISSMGTGNKLDPTKFEVSDIYNTSICPLAKVMRKELRKREIKSLKVVYSKELPLKAKGVTEDSRIPGSISFVPSVAGLIISSEVIKDLIKR
jgi:tRNA A37 threonylcarbamoyladenosine dehydratase